MPSSAPLSSSTEDQSQPDLLFSFAAAGWLQMYHFGVAKALQDSGIASPEAVQRVDAELGIVKFAGSSAGALAASALVTGVDFEALREYACACAIDCRGALLGAFNIRHYVQRGVELFATSAFKDATAKLRQARRDKLRRRQAVRRADRHRVHFEDEAPRRGAARRRARVTAGAGSTRVDEPEDGSDSGYASDSSSQELFAEGEFPDAEPVDEAVDDSASATSAAMVDIAQRMQQRLEVYATTLPFLTAKKFTKFEEVEDLDEALTASCLLVPLAGMPLRLRDTKQWVMDGGVAAFQPRAGERGVVTVSTMYFASADIKPSVFVPIWWGLYPPNDQQYRALFALGYNDCLDGLLRKRLVSHSKFSMLRDKYENTTASVVPRRGVVTLFRDICAFWFFMFVLRPVGLFLVYCEMFVVLISSAAVALLHDLLPRTFGLAALLLGTHTSRRRNGTRIAAWADVYRAVRNLISMRVPLHLIVGSRIPVNARRLERYSRVYRALRPFLG